MDGFLAVTPGGQPSLLVRRPHHRDHLTPGPWPRVLYRDLKELPQTPRAKRDWNPKAPWLWSWMSFPPLWLSVMQEQLFPGRPIVDLSPFIRAQRMVKSAYELTQLAPGRGHPGPGP